jgi:hypothetical protein
MTFFECAHQVTYARKNQKEAGPAVSMGKV